MSNAAGLDQLSVKALRDGRHFSLPWVLLHLIEETARHAGHADFLREAIDGTQAQLAAAVGRDKTRLIAILDRLEDRGLLHRTPDLDDRRNRIVALTDAGRILLADCRRDIRAMEADLLSTLSAADRTAFVHALSTLAEPTPEDTGVRQ